MYTVYIYFTDILMCTVQERLSTVHIPKPIIKWVGGKTQILNKILEQVPCEINNYHEIFLGGGSVLLGVLSCVKSGHITVGKNIYAYDLNEQLISMYQNIQSNWEALYEEIEKIVREYNTCGNNNTDICRQPKDLDEALKCKENYYYWIRSKYNQMDTLMKNTLVGSAMFIFLNKTCFRGVYRVGPSGFNVSYGYYKNPEIINYNHLKEIHELIQGVVFVHSDCVESLKNVCSNDYVYLDPPYAPETSTSFVAYTEQGFSIGKHCELFGLIRGLGKDIRISMSNADVKLVRDNFPSDEYHVETVVCKRTINSKNPKMVTNEVIVRNY